MKFEHEAAFLEYSQDRIEFLYESFLLFGGKGEDFNKRKDGKIHEFVAWCKQENEEAMTVKRGKRNVSYQELRDDSLFREQ